MSEQRLARSERLALVALMRRLGPDAPTLCEGWDTRDLAVHLVIRDRKPVAALGAIVPKLAERLPALAATRDNTEAELQAMNFEQLLGVLAQGAPKWSPAGWSGGDELMNTAEFLVHHEDVRRAQDNWSPRGLSWDAQNAAFRTCRVMLTVAALKAGKHLLIEAPGFGHYGAGQVSQGTRRISGAPLEILLYLFGRQDHARVHVEETPAR